MENKFVPYNIAYKLREIGFDEPCFGYFETNIDVFLIKDNNLITRKDLVRNDVDVLAPLWQQVIDWFRIKYGLAIHIDSSKIDWNQPIIRSFGKVECKRILGELNFRYSYDTYEEAREVAILKSIEIVERLLK